MGSNMGNPRSCLPLLHRCLAAFRPAHHPRLTQGSMGAQCKSQGICPTLRDPMRKVLFLQKKKMVTDAYRARSMGCRGNP